MKNWHSNTTLTGWLCMATPFIASQRFYRLLLDAFYSSTGTHLGYFESDLGGTIADGVIYPPAPQLASRTINAGDLLRTFIQTEAKQVLNQQHIPKSARLRVAIDMLYQSDDPVEDAERQWLAAVNEQDEHYRPLLMALHGSLFQTPAYGLNIYAHQAVREMTVLDLGDQLDTLPALQQQRYQRSLYLDLNTRLEDYLRPQMGLPILFPDSNV